MPLTEEGNYIHESQAFKCNGCGCWYPEDNHKEIDTGEWVCNECFEVEYK